MPEGAIKALDPKGRKVLLNEYDNHVAVNCAECGHQLATAGSVEKLYENGYEPNKKPKKEEAPASE